jgi:hypothetical protein
MSFLVTANSLIMAAIDIRRTGKRKPSTTNRHQHFVRRLPREGFHMKSLHILRIAVVHAMGTGVAV